MVIAEARAAAVPVLVSDACGIAPELEAEAVLPMSAGIDSWTAACMTLLKSQREPEIRSWRAVAEEQVRCYRQLTPATD